MTNLPLSVLMLTLDEEANLGVSLPRIAEFCDDVVLVDSGSRDRTAELARAHGARVVPHAFEGHARQWNWAIENVELRHEWIFLHDPDHFVTPELERELRRLFERGIAPDCDGIYLCRRNVFRGRAIAHGGYYPKLMLKIFRRGKGRLDEAEFDYRVYVDGKTTSVSGDLIEHNLKEDDITFWIAKHNGFAVKQAQEEIRRRRGEIPWLTVPRFFGTPDQRTLWLKVRWYAMPLYVRPFLYFFYRYFLRLGFLDGKTGFLFHFLQGFWYRLLVDIKIDELERADAGRISARSA